MRYLKASILIIALTVATSVCFGQTPTAVGRFGLVILNGFNLTATTAGAVATQAGSETFTNKSLNAESTGNVLTLPFVQWWPVGLCYSGGAYEDSGWSATAAMVFDCQAGANTMYASVEFPDSTATYYSHGVLLPSDWTGAIDLRVLWKTSGTSGNVVWQVQTACSADTETLDPSWNVANTVTDAAQGTTNRQNSAALTGITTTGCAAGEFLHLRMIRDAAHVSDTLAATADLIGVEATLRRAI